MTQHSLPVMPFQGLAPGLLPWPFCSKYPQDPQIKAFTGALPMGRLGRLWVFACSAFGVAIVVQRSSLISEIHD